jgi:hypothetical protein
MASLHRRQQISEVGPQQCERVVAMLVGRTQTHVHAFVPLIGIFSGLLTIICAASAAYVGRMVKVIMVADHEGMVRLRSQRMLCSGKTSLNE